MRLSGTSEIIYQRLGRCVHFQRDVAQVKVSNPPCIQLPFYFYVVSTI